MNIVHGEPFVLPDNFWSKIRVGAEDACWPHRGAECSGRYAHVKIDKRSYQAHRLLMMSLGHDLRDLIVRHTCDNPPCCNPKHLIPGTCSENNLDAVSRKRWTQARPGSANSKAKLTEAQVLKIREVWAVLPRHPSGTVGIQFQSALARFYKVHQRTINDVILRVSWSHI